MIGDGRTSKARIFCTHPFVLLALSPGCRASARVSLHFHHHKGATTMSLPLEREILAQLKKTLCNSKLRIKDLLEWSSGHVTPHDGEILVEVKLHDMTWRCCVPAGADKRKPT